MSSSAHAIIGAGARPRPLNPPTYAAVRPSLAAVYAEHFAMVHRTLRRLGVAEAELDDATQDAFLVVHRKLGEFEGRSSLRTWLFGIALRIASDYRQRAARRGAPRAVEDGLVEERSPDPFDSALRSEAERLLDRLVHELDVERRAVFISVDMEEMTMREAAEALGIGINTVGWRLRAARKQFNGAVARLRAAASRRSA